MNIHRKLMVLGINELLERELITLQPPSGAATECGHVITQLAGRTSMITWRDVGFGELQVSVWWGYRHDLENYQIGEPRFVGATVSGWLERATAKHLQGKGRSGLSDLYVRRGEREVLESMPDPTPRGYAPVGQFFL